MPKIWKCCCCSDGAVIPRWKNVTRVRPAGDSGGAHYTAIPSVGDGIRYDTGNADKCPDATAGKCGVWLSPADKNGVSAQLITDTLDDIQPPVTADSTHTPIDHNNYQAFPSVAANALVAGDIYQIKTVGTTDFTAVGASENKVGVTFTATGAGSGSGTAFLAVDMRVTRLFGGQWIHARKQWHGKLNLKDSIQPNAIKSGYTWTGGLVNAGEASGPNYTYESFPTDRVRNRYRTVQAHSDCLVKTDGYPDYTASYDSTSTVNKKTGIVDTTGSLIESGATDSEAWSFIQSDWNYVIDYFSTFSLMGSPLSDDVFVREVAGGGGYELVKPGFTIGSSTWPEIALETIGLFHRTLRSYTDDANHTVIVTMEESAVLTETYLSYQKTTYSYPCAGSTPNGSRKITGWLSLGDIYSDSECFNSDFLPLFGAWDMSDLNLAKFRAYQSDLYADDVLAIAPLVVLDEVPHGVEPVLNYNPAMDDFSATQNGDGSWPQMAWHDPNDYYWEWNGNTRTMPAGWTGGAGAVLHTGVRTGETIAHTQQGSDRHWWSAYGKLKRDEVRFAGVLQGYVWNADQNGGYGDPVLGRMPPVAMRWMNNFEAQSDPQLASGLTSYGNLPQGWWRQLGTAVTGGKFVMATNNWQAVNFSRPCGPADKYAVDQTTVCCVTANAAPVFTVKASGNAHEPSGTGGLAVNDYVLIEGDGIRRITGISGSVGAWTITCGALLESLPAGYTTILETVSPGSFDDGMVHLGKLRWYLTAAGSCAANSQNKTGVHIEWKFDRRAIHLPSPPTFYAGVDGCLSATKTQFQYSSGACPAVVGIVPFYSAKINSGDDLPDMDSQTPINQPVEKFPNQTMFDFPTLGGGFDATYGASGQAAVYLTMPDPFWQQPFKPCDSADFQWQEDVGTSDDDYITDGVQHRLFAHHPVVEAIKDIPAGKSLPAGVSLYFAADIPPPFYPLGIPVGDVAGNFGSVEMDWGLLIRICRSITGNLRFADYYATFADTTNIQC